MGGMYIASEGKSAVSAAIQEVQAVQEDIAAHASLPLVVGAFGYGLSEKGAVVSSLLEEAYRIRAVHLDRLYSRLRALDSTVFQVSTLDQESSGQISESGGGQ